MRYRGKHLFAAGAVAALLVTAACSSSGSGGSSGSSGSSGGSTGSQAAKGGTYTVGVLVDATGPAASGNKTAPLGVKAGAVYAARQGYTIKYVVGDTATNPATALAAAQKFVTRDHVDAVIAHSALAFAAAPYLTAHHIPVIGAAEDGPEWQTAKNMFSTFGVLHTTKVSTTMGTFLKNQGVTNVASIGYSISPSSAESAKAAIESAKNAGLKGGYLNSKFPFGGTDVGPVALAIKKSGADALVTSIDPNTAFSLITALRQQGANIKVAVLPTGYGDDLLQAGPGALKAAQNVYFLLGYEPIEMNTAATKSFSADLRAVGISTVPTFAEYNGYTAIGLLVQGLKGAGAKPTSTSLIASLSKIHDFDALGLFGGRKLDVNDRDSLVGGVDNCQWISKLEGSTFTPVKGAAPVCGTAIPGKTVDAN